MDAPASPEERRILLLLAAVQFVNVVDFMLVMPLGPDFARELGIPTANLGIVGGVYTAAASVAGLVGATFLDRFDRRIALMLCLLGLGLGTAAGGLATGLPSMLLARAVAGAFGGPASALAMSIVADVVPPARRGQAMGRVMSAFAFASVAGVPLGLRLATMGGWRLPFFAIALMGLIAAGATRWVLPPMRAHMDRDGKSARTLRLFFADPAVRIALITMAALMLGTFAIVPNLSAYMQFNWHLPRARLELLYFLGGAVTLVAMILGGKAVDRRGPRAVVLVGTSLTAAVMIVAFIAPQTWVPMLVIIPVFMMSNSIRMVAFGAASSKVAPPAERARFMSIQGSVQHLASATGAVMSSLVLAQGPGGAILHMDRLGWVALILALSIPFLVASLQRALAARAAA